MSARKKLKGQESKSRKANKTTLQACLLCIQKRTYYWLYGKTNYAIKRHHVRKHSDKDGNQLITFDDLQKNIVDADDKKVKEAQTTYNFYCKPLKSSIEKSSVVAAPVDKPSHQSSHLSSHRASSPDPDEPEPVHSLSSDLVDSADVETSCARILSSTVVGSFDQPSHQSSHLSSPLASSSGPFEPEPVESSLTDFVDSADVQTSGIGIMSSTVTGPVDVRADQSVDQISLAPTPSEAGQESTQEDVVQTSVQSKQSSIKSYAVQQKRQVSNEDLQKMLCDISSKLDAVCRTPNLMTGETAPSSRSSFSLSKCKNLHEIDQLLPHITVTKNGEGAIVLCKFVITI